MKLAGLIWIMLGTTLAGMGVAAVVAVPSLAAEAAKYIPIAVVAGALLAMPLSVVVARKIEEQTAARRR